MDQIMQRFDEAKKAALDCDREFFYFHLQGNVEEMVKCRNQKKKYVEEMEKCFKEQQECMEAIHRLNDSWALTRWFMPV